MWAHKHGAAGRSPYVYENKTDTPSPPLRMLSYRRVFSDLQRLFHNVSGVLIGLARGKNRVPNGNPNGIPNGNPNGNHTQNQNQNQKQKNLSKTWRALLSFSSWMVPHPGL